MLNKRRKASDDGIGQLHFANILEQARKQQRAGVVINTVAVSAIRHRITGMLENAGAIAQRKEMSNLDLRYDVSISQSGHRTDRKVYSGLRIPALGPERGKVALRRLHPRHRAARRIGSFADGVTTKVVG